MKKILFLYTTLVLCLVALQACNLPAANVQPTSASTAVPAAPAAPAPAPIAANVSSEVQSIVRAWIDFPLTGMELHLKEYTLMAHVADGAGISQIEWAINDEVVSTDPVAKASNTTDVLSEFQYKWLPPEPGDYVIKVRAQSAGGNWSGPAEARIKVLGDATITVTPTLILTPTPTATQPPANAPLALVDGKRSGDIFNIGNCGTNEMTFSVRATRPEQVTYMFLFYSLQDIGSGEKTPSNGGTPMVKTGKDTWSLTLKFNQVENYTKFSQSWFIYQFISQGPNQELTRAKPVSDLQFVSCGGNLGVKPGIKPGIPEIKVPTKKFVPWE